jgi:hypothetical protein
MFMTIVMTVTMLMGLTTSLRLPGCLPALKRLRAADEATSVTEATRARLKDVLSVARPEIRFDMW